MVIIEKQKGYIHYLVELEAGHKIEFPAHKAKSLRPMISGIKRDVKYYGRDFKTNVIGDRLIIERTE